MVNGADDIKKRLISNGWLLDEDSVFTRDPSPDVIRRSRYLYKNSSKSTLKFEWLVPLLTSMIVLAHLVFTLFQNAIHP